MKNCEECSQPIGQARLEAIPGTTFCVTCAGTKGPRPVAFMNYAHKTAGSIIVVDGNNQEHVRQARRAYERKR